MIYHILLIYLVFLKSSILDAREVENPLGRFAQTDPTYDYDRTPEDPTSDEIDLAEMRDKGGLTIAGFPEGCAYARMDEPLSDHVLGYGRIKLMGSSWAFQYIDRSAPGSFAITEVAHNLGLMGQNPEQSISVNLMARTPGGSFVVAQLLDRSDMGLGPIVTCISPVFTGTIVPGRSMVFGEDYWVEYERFRDFRDDYYRRERRDRWKYRWKQKIYDWREYWRGKGQGRYTDYDKRHRRDREREKPRIHFQLSDDDDEGRSHRGKLRTQLLDDRGEKRLRSRLSRDRDREEDRVKTRPGRAADVDKDRFSDDDDQPRNQKGKIRNQPPNDRDEKRVKLRRIPGRDKDEQRVKKARPGGRQDERDKDKNSARARPGKERHEDVDRVRARSSRGHARDEEKLKPQFERGEDRKRNRKEKDK